MDVERAAKELASQCLSKFSDAEASLDTRSFSLSIIVSQILNGNSAMLGYVPEMMQCLKDSSFLIQPDTGSKTREFHQQVTAAVTAIFDVSPDNFVDGFREFLQHYLLQLVSCEDLETASLACEFWALHADILMTSVFEPQLQKLITVLMDLMCRKDVERYSFEAICDQAEWAFESVVDACPCKLMCKTFGRLLETRIKSDLWPEKEAAIIALGVFVDASDSGQQ